MPGTLCASVCRRARLGRLAAGVHGSSGGRECTAVVHVYGFTDGARIWCTTNDIRYWTALCKSIFFLR